MAQEQDRPVAWVTSVTSFLGRHVALALTRKGFDVAGFARAPLNEAEFATQWGFRYFEYGPFDPDLLRRMEARVGPPATVFHAIGSGSVGQADADPAADRERTVRTTECLLEHLVRTAPRARLIFPSSAAVYGVTSAKLISEDTKPGPVSVYGANKYLAEKLCRDYAAHGGQNTVIVRFFSVYGPPQSKLLLWDIGKRLLAGERIISLGGTGEESRDLIHITDAAATVAALSLLVNPPALLNVGSGHATSVKSLVEMLANALDITAEIRFDGHSRPGNPPHQQADISRLSRFGFSASIPLERGIADYASWLQKEHSSRN